VANIKSQIKRNKQNEKRRLRNRTVRGSARTAVKNAQTAALALHVSADATTNEESKASILTAISALDKAANKGVIHPKNAARRKSRLMKAATKAAKAPAPVAVEKKKKAPAKKAAAQK